MLGFVCALPRYRGLRFALAAFRRERRGVAAVEFALFLPILLALLYAGAELVNAVDHQRKVSQLTRTLADLTSQGDSENPIAAALMQDIAAVGKPILAPYTSTSAMLRVSAIGIYSGKIAVPYVCSAWASGMAARSVGYATDLTVPTNYQRAGARYVVAEVKMPYVSLLGPVAPNFVKNLTLNFNFSENVPWPVRGGKSYSSSADTEVVLPSGKNCP